MKTFGKIVDAVLSIYMFKNCSHPRDCNIPSTSRVDRRDKVKDLEDRGRLGIRQPQGFSTP